MINVYKKKSADPLQTNGFTEDVCYWRDCLDGKDSTALVPYARPATQLSIIAEKVTFDSIVYTDLFKA